MSQQFPFDKRIELLTLKRNQCPYIDCWFCLIPLFRFSFIHQNHKQWCSVFSYPMKWFLSSLVSPCLFLDLFSKRIFGSSFGFLFIYLFGRVLNSLCDLPSSGVFSILAHLFCFNILNCCFTPESDDACLEVQLHYQFESLGATQPRTCFSYFVQKRS